MVVSESESPEGSEKSAVLSTISFPQKGYSHQTEYAKSCQDHPPAYREVSDRDQTILHLGNYPDWAPCPNPPHHPWAECQAINVFFSVITGDKKNHYMALSDHDARKSPYVSLDVHRLVDELL